MVHILTKSQITSLRETFNMFDPERTGFIHLEHLGAVMHYIGDPLTPNEVEDLIAKSAMVRSEDGTLTFPEMLTVLAPHVHEREQAERGLRETFDFFQLSKDGVMCASELAYGMKRLGCVLSVREVMSMIKEVERGTGAAATGGMDFDCFRRIMGRMPTSFENY